MGRSRCKRQRKNSQISSSNIVNGEGNSDLIPGLPNDITLGPIMARLPWYTRSKLIILSPAWRKALRDGVYHYPYHTNANTGRNSVILYGHTPFGGNRLVLKIFQEGIVRALPLPKSIPRSSPFKFFLTDERIYYLTCDGQRKKICHVKMLDLTKGLLEWQSLPPLALAKRNLIDFIYATTGPDGNSTCMYMHSFIPSPSIEYNVSYSMPSQNTTQSCFSIQGKNCSVWQLLHGGEAQWHKISSVPLLRTLQNQQDDETRPPLFLDIFDQHTRLRHLYKRFTACDAKLLQYNVKVLRYLLVFRDDCSGESLRGLHRFLHHGDKLKLFKLRPQRVMEVGNGTELNSFRLFWSRHCCVREENDLTALKFSADLSQQLRGWKCQLTLPSKDRDGERDLVFNISQQGNMHMYVIIDTAVP